MENWDRFVIVYIIGWEVGASSELKCHSFNTQRRKSQCWGNRSQAAMTPEAPKAIKPRKIKSWSQHSGSWKHTEWVSNNKKRIFKLEDNAPIMSKWPWINLHWNVIQEKKQSTKSPWNYIQEWLSKQYGRGKKLKLFLGEKKAGKLLKQVWVSLGE